MSLDIQNVWTEQHEDSERVATVLSILNHTLIGYWDALYNPGYRKYIQENINRRNRGYIRVVIVLAILVRSWGMFFFSFCCHGNMHLIGSAFLFFFFLESTELIAYKGKVNYILYKIIPSFWFSLNASLFWSFIFPFMCYQILECQLPLK